MSTSMMEKDWHHTLRVFHARLPRRGRKAADDGLFLEAMHFFTVENVRWRALPERSGHWSSVWKRCDRLSKAGVFEAFFDTLAAMSASAHLIQMFDSTIVRAHVSAAGAKGQQGRAKSEIYAWMKSGTEAAAADQMMAWYAADPRILLYDGAAPGYMRGPSKIHDYYTPTMWGLCGFDTQFPELVADSDVYSARKWIRRY